jgi:hypothetical protein
LPDGESSGDSEIDLDPAYFKNNLDAESDQAVDEVDIPSFYF